MARKRYKPEETERQIGVTEVTYYRWRREFGGLKSEQVRRLEDLEPENSGCARRSPI